MTALESVQARICAITTRQRERHRMRTCRALNVSDGRRCGSLGYYDEERQVHLCDLHGRLASRYPEMVRIAP